MMEPETPQSRPIPAVVPTRRQLEMLVNRLEGRPLRSYAGTTRKPRAVGGATERAVLRLEQAGWIVSRYVVGGGELTETGRRLAEAEVARRDARKSR